MKRESLPASVRRVCLIAIVLIACETFAGAATEKVLHQFVATSHGAFPGGTLVADANGNDYGITNYGGAYDYGVVFELTAGASGKWQQKVIYNFQGTDDGSYPNSLAIDAQGNLFGATAGGGSGGYGVAFELSPRPNGAWTETVLHVFASDATGYSPAGTVVDSAGNVYGTASGGLFNWNSCLGDCGLIYRLSRTTKGWAETVLYKFEGKRDGSFPSPTSLVLDSAGNLYGSASACTYIGPCYFTVFELTPGASQWTETTLSTDVPYASGLVFDPAGNIYGVSTASGLIFELTPRSDRGWNETVLYNFENINAYPYGLTLDSAGNLLGTTGWGGTGCSNCGTVFKLSPNAGTWTETTLYNFAGGNDGQLPMGPVLIDPAGNLIGTTYFGTEANYGTVFELSAGEEAGTESVVYNFGGPPSDGGTPYAGVIFDSAGNIYGTTASGGTSSFYGGTVFEITP